MQTAVGTIDAIDRCYINFRFDSSRIARGREGNNIRLSPRMAIAVTNTSRSGFGIRRGNPTSDRTPLRIGCFTPRFSKTPRHPSVRI